MSSSEGSTGSKGVTRAQFTAAVVIVAASAVGLGLLLAHLFGI